MSQETSLDLLKHVVTLYLKPQKFLSGTDEHFLKEPGTVSEVSHSMISDMHSQLQACEMGNSINTQLESFKLLG